jgi:hypothetical protein
MQLRNDYQFIELLPTRKNQKIKELALARSQ